MLNHGNLFALWPFSGAGLEMSLEESCCSVPPSELSPVSCAGKGCPEPLWLDFNKDLLSADTMIGFCGILCMCQTREISCLKNQFVAAGRT